MSTANEFGIDLTERELTSLIKEGLAGRMVETIVAEVEKELDTRLEQLATEIRSKIKNQVERVVRGYTMRALSVRNSPLDGTVVVNVLLNEKESV